MTSFNPHFRRSTGRRQAAIAQLNSITNYCDRCLARMRAYRAHIEHNSNWDSDEKFTELSWARSIEQRCQEVNNDAQNISSELSNAVNPEHLRMILEHGIPRLTFKWSRLKTFVDANCMDAFHPDAPFF